jgi:hypothetical protein
VNEFFLDISLLMEVLSKYLTSYPFIIIIILQALRPWVLFVSCLIHLTDDVQGLFNTDTSVAIDI